MFFVSSPINNILQKHPLKSIMDKILVINLRLWHYLLEADPPSPPPATHTHTHPPTPHTNSNPRDQRIYPVCYNIA